jgi:sterol desaturase/sphingolipid hydroxylase (fatty acid hydroxylase superfamily)
LAAQRQRARESLRLDGDSRVGAPLGTVAWRLKILSALPSAHHEDHLAASLPGWLNAVLIGGTFAIVLWFERRRPLRRRTERAANHEIRNLLMALLSAAVIRVAEKPATDRFSRLVHQRRWGLLKAVELPPAVEVAAGVVLLDYTLYIWHVLTHRLPFLWRFHSVHHMDLDLTASTALRFHFAEMVLSVPWRVAQVVIIGAAPLPLSVWQTATLIAILFHHSNIQLPLSIERWLCRVFMTPRMHGIHHSIFEEETNSNWSTIFAWPDYAHDTYRINIPQQSVTIGVPEYRDLEELGLAEIVTIPFRGQRAHWKQLRDDKPERTELLAAVPPSMLAR